MPLGSGYQDNATSTVYENARVLKNKGGILYAINGYNSKASAQFIQVHDAAAVPADNAVPAMVITAPTVANFSLDLGERGRYFTNGIVVCNSSTGPTKTIGSADCWFDAQIG